MPLIIDPDLLNRGTEVTIEASTKTITLSIAGNLDAAGVTGQALYSFLKEEWKDVASLIPYAFPMLSITPEQFEFISGWKPANDATRNLLRTCGWREIDDNSVTNREYMGIISLGSIGALNTAYYAFTNGNKTPFNFAGPVNQGIQTFGTAAHGNFDNRAQGLTTFIRTQGQTYGSATTDSIGLTALNYIANRFPLTESLNSKISETDENIDANTPYTNMSITFGSVVRVIGGSNFDFKIVVDGANGTVQEINNFVQRQLRLNSNINETGAPTIGSLQSQLTGFVGDTLKTETGVFIDNYQVTDTNNIIFTDNGSVERAFPFIASGTLNFNSNLTADSTSIYRVFFYENYGSASALLVNDNDQNPISGLISGRSSIGFSFDYDANNQGGRTPDTNASVIVIAIGLAGAQYVSAQATITKSAGQNISLVAPLERNYTNPA